MEIIIAFVVLGFGLWWFFLREPNNTTSSAPYKVETPETEPIPAYDVVPQPVIVVDGAGAVEITAPPVEAAPVKKPRKPRAPKVVAPAEKAAAIKAAPKTPRSKKS